MMTIGHDEKCLIYYGMISGENMIRCEDACGSEVDYQAISEISNTFRKKFSQESFIISLDAN